MRNLKILLFLLICSLISILRFDGFGEPIWRSAVTKLKGDRTTREVLEALKPKLAANLDQFVDGENLVILGFKEERRLELWKDQGGLPVKVREYPFTGYSGTVGPKLVRGDGQIPEGIYKIDYLNPNSSFHLSMKLSYPNEFDSAMGKEDQRNDLGDDIFIHGSSVTIGCIPIGDKAIEELYYLVAANGIEKCVAIISPCDFREGKGAPDIPGIDWEEVLYDQIKEHLKPF